MALVFDETAAADLIEVFIISGDPAVEPFKTLQVNPCEGFDCNPLFES